MNNNKTFFLSAVVIILLLFFLAGCQTPAPLNRITFEKDSPLSGKITVVPANTERGQSKEFRLERGKNAYTFDFDEINTTKVLVMLNHRSSENLPENESREAVITAEISLNKRKTDQHVEVDMKKGSIALHTGPLKGAHCNNLYDVSYHPNTLDIQFLGFKNLTSCTGKDYEKINPLLIGLRDLTKTDFFSLPNLFSSTQELFMGKQFTNEYTKQNRKAILPKDHPTSIYLQDVMERIVKVSDMPDLQPHVHVINADVLNAFALPGGYVFVFRGLMDAAESESQLAGVLGHEWAHVTARHGTKNMSRAIFATGAAIMASEALKSLAGKKGKSGFLKGAEPIVGSMLMAGSTLFMMHKSRKAELEADKIGSQYAWAAGFEPWGIADMFEIFKEEAGGSSTTLEELFKTHPNHDTRIQNVLDLCAFYYPEKRDYVHSSNAFKRAKRKLLNLPLPSKKQSKNIGMGFANAINNFTKNTVLTETFQHYFEGRK